MPANNGCNANISALDNSNIITILLGSVPYILEQLLSFYKGGYNMAEIKNITYFILYLILNCWHT